MFRKAMANMSTSISKDTLQSTLKSVLGRISVASTNKSDGCSKKYPRLVAVSKTKPSEAVIAAYEVGQQHFGENYVNELVEKSNDQDVLQQCKDIKWHFIGHLQRNKVNKVISAPNLYIVETVESMKIAQALDAAWGKMNKNNPLKVMVQVNTSAEENKHGCESGESCDLVQFVREKCKNLQFAGLMTIGSFDHDLTKGPNPDFQKLLECRDKVCQDTGLTVEDIEISMGMSNDFEHAIKLGSTSVRVGSTIFGARHYPNKTPMAPTDKTPATVTGDTKGLENSLTNMSVTDKPVQ